MTNREPVCEIIGIVDSHVPVFERLVQCYEAEFSSITGKFPSAEGVFPLDTYLDDSHTGYLLYVNGIPAGFNIIAVKANNLFEVCEFYILPVFRKQHLGYTLASDVFDRYSGNWEVKQIQGAENAISFWRRAIGRYTDGLYSEDIYSDSYWGVVTRQRFSNG